MGDKRARLKLLLASAGLVLGGGTLVALLLHGPGPSTPPSPTAPSVLLVTIDGLRQEEFFGPDRESLMPFLWKEAIPYGQAVRVRVTNGTNVSYPGYNELLTGRVDPKLTSNERIPNPNLSVLAWLSGHRPFGGRVAVFSSWYMMDYIIPREHDGLVVNAGFAKVAPLMPSVRGRALDKAMDEAPLTWPGVRPDALTTEAAALYLEKRKPRVLFVALGEPDERGHAGDWPAYLSAVRASDQHVAKLWKTMQAMPEYAGSSTLLVTTDHGRGATPATWGHHGPGHPEAASIWLAATGPRVKKTGWRETPEPFALAQVAATVAAAVGRDYAGRVHGVAPVIEGLLAD